MSIPDSIIQHTTHYLGGCKHATIENSVTNLITIDCKNCIRIINVQLAKLTPNPSDLGSGKSFTEETLRKLPEWMIVGIEAKKGSQLIKIATHKVLVKQLDEIVIVPRLNVFDDLVKLDNALQTAIEHFNYVFAVDLKAKYKQVGTLSGFKISSEVHLKYIPTMAVFLSKLVNIAYFGTLTLQKVNQLHRNQTNPSQRAFRCILTALRTNQFSQIDFNSLFVDDPKTLTDTWILKACGNYHTTVKNCVCGNTLCQFVLNKPSMPNTVRYVAEHKLYIE